VFEDDDFLDGCSLDFTEEPTPDDEVELTALFAEAINPNNPKTVEEQRDEWEALFGHQS
jgi:hypothetical protein